MGRGDKAVAFCFGGGRQRISCGHLEAGAGKAMHWEPCTDLCLSPVKFLPQNESKHFPSPRVCQLETKNYNCGPPQVHICPRARCPGALPHQ